MTGAIVIGNTLYIDGGEIVQNVSGASWVIGVPSREFKSCLYNLSSGCEF